jgi:FkbM family methyltransferase
LPDGSSAFHLHDSGERRIVLDSTSPQWFERANFGGMGIGTAVAIRRSALERWEGYDERLGPGAMFASEEHFAFFRLVELGFRVAYVPQATVRHPASATRPQAEARLARDAEWGAAYLLFLWDECPRYRMHLLRHLLTGFVGLDRGWRAASAEMPRLTRARRLRAFAAGSRQYLAVRPQFRTAAADPGSAHEGPNILARGRSWIASAKSLLGAGVTWGSILKYPFRRFSSAPSRLRLKDGTVLLAPPGEPLLTLFDEVWAKSSYALPLSLPVQTIIDVGANFGVFAVWAARRYHPTRLVCVEPSAEAVAILREALHLNGLADATVVAAACAGKSGSAPLYSRGEQVMNSLFARDNYGSSFRPLADVRTISLDDLFRDCGLNRCDLLKIDCEGAEYEILLAASTSTLASVQAIVLEYHLGMNQHDPQELQQHLQRHGFTVEIGPLEDAEGGYMRAWRPAAVSG